MGNLISQTAERRTWMASKNSGKVPDKAILKAFKNEVASSLNINLSSGENPTSHEAGSVGGEMVKRMIAYAEQNMPK
jgi:hypothetical protein